MAAAGGDAPGASARRVARAGPRSTGSPARELGGGPIAALADLQGKTLGVAGGPLDKSWLLLQAYAERSGADIAKRSRVVFGAPPLLVIVPSITVSLLLTN